jgi:hypothetical protein
VTRQRESGSDSLLGWSGRLCNRTLGFDVHRLGVRFLEQPGNAVGRLGTLANPMLGTRSVETQTHFPTGSDRIVKADALYVATVAFQTLVCDDDFIEGALLGTTPG